MRNGSEVRVGIIFLLGLLLLGLAVYFLLGYGYARDRYVLYAVFDQAQIQRGDDVRLAGVLVGEVTAVRLTPDNRAEVTMRVNRIVTLHQNDVVTIGTGALLGERYVDIRPAPRATQGPAVPPQSLLRGQTRPQLEDLIITSQALVTNLAITITSLNRIINDPQMLAALRASLANFQAATGEAQRLLASLNAMAGENRTQLLRLTSNLAHTSQEVQVLVADLSAQLRESELPENVGGAAASIRSAAERIDDITAQFQQLAKDPALRDSLGTALQNVKQASDRLVAIADNMERASQNIEGASAEAKQAAQRANEAVGRVTGAKGGKGLALPRLGAQVDLQYLPEHSRWWTEGNLDLTLGRSLLRTGVADLGETNRFNLQLGREQGAGRVRYGIVQSEPGLGLDWPLWGGTWSLDLFDPNQPRANLITAWPVRPGFSLTAGVRDALDQPQAAVGLRVSK